MKDFDGIAGILFALIFIFDLLLAAQTYRQLYLEDSDLCSEITKRKIKLEQGPKSGLIVKQMRLNHHSLAWTAHYNCHFKVDASGNDGITVVIQYLSLRKNDSTGECIDYVQFKAKNGYTSQKFCGRFNAELIMDSIFGIASKLEALNNTFEDPEGEVTTYVFIAKEALSIDEDLDLNIVYTTFKPCKYSPRSYKPCLETVRKICIYQDYFNDMIINCPYIDCVDEGGCAPKEMNEGTSIGNKVLIASVTTLLSVFIIFIWCLCICRKYEKLCWAPQFANSNTPPPQPARVMEMNESPTQSQSISPAPALAAPDDQEDKDLPPSYESLFPSR